MTLTSRRIGRVAPNSNDFEFESLGGGHSLSEFYLTVFFLEAIYIVPGSTPQSKHPKLVCGKYEYFLQRSVGMPVKKRWRCSFYYKTRCQAAVSTCNGVLENINIHNHVPRIHFDHSLDYSEYIQYVTIVNRVPRLKW